MLSIKQRQYDLYYVGYYYTGNIDGKEGALLKTAYGNFQKARGLTVDKIYGAKTNSELIAFVKDVQTKLKNLGYYKSSIDGIAGSNMISAIKSFQKANSLTADGIAGTKTLDKLNSKVSSITSSSVSWKAIKYFKRAEFKCPCGKCNGFPVEPDLNMVKLLDKIREAYGKPITITSGVRCQSYNDSLSGSIKNSAHIQGKAADFYIPGQNDTASGRTAVVKKAYSLGAKYSYANTTGMGKTVHVNI
jgi:peptidoglycan hydrolase-like protein with peptidoglycan-binding domain